MLRSAVKCVLPTDGAQRSQIPRALHSNAPRRVHTPFHVAGWQPALFPGQRPQLARPTQAAEGDDAPVDDADGANDAVLSNLRSSAGLQKNLSFVAFWMQLALTLVSAGVLLFSVFITSAGGPGNLAIDITKFFTLGGVLLSFISTFFAHGFLTLSRKLAAGEGINTAWLSSSLTHNTTINLLGIGITTVGLQASVGTLVGKTLMTATQTPFQVGGSGSLVSLDVFALQASTNILLCHLVGLAFANIMRSIVDKALLKKAMA